MAAAALLTAWGNRGKNKSDAATALSDAALRLVAPLQTRIDQLEARATLQDREIQRQAAELNRRDQQILAMTKELAELHAGVRLLTYQVTALGQQPLFKLPDEGKSGA